jgi:hypothetical protein
MNKTYGAHSGWPAGVGVTDSVGAQHDVLPMLRDY